MESSLKEYRCANCKKLLCKGVLIESVVEVKCRGCGEITTFQGEPASKYMCLVYPCPHRVTVADLK